MANASEIIGSRLYHAGCRRAFGIPGGEVLVLMDGLKKSGIEFLLTKHENNAGFMAEGGFHANGAPGILVATLGPGVANAVNVVANAFQDRVPLIFLTGCVDADEALTYTHQVFDHSELLKSVTKESIKVVDGAVDVVIDKALAIALDGQPGPVHVDIPISVAAKEQLAQDFPVDREIIVRNMPSPSAPAEGAALESARNWLREAKQPLMIAGVDVLNQHAEKAVAEFARDFMIPLITTYKAKGVLPEDDPLALGGAGLSPLADKQLLPLLRESDLIILAGYDPIEMRVGWRNPWDEGARVLEFCAVPNTHYMHRASLSFIGDIAEGLKTLRKNISPQPVWNNKEPHKVRSELKTIFSATGTPGLNEEWGPAAVIDIMRKALPRNGVATADSGAHRILLSQMWECYEARGLLQSTALCTMGCAVPLAIGFGLAKPERPIVAFVGDAGMEMVLGELATLRDLKLPVVIIVFVDESLALIELKQRNSGLPNLGVDFGATDFPAVAEALGGIGRWVSNPDELREGLEGAFERQTFTLLACKIGEKVYDKRF
ncbi:MAG: thiamine pyrophosphate-binding protein [SAR324 cluster bacterium]|nr:thiamine pyrophosphate-binding protein [SAR324 cluster bacterium]